MSADALGVTRVIVTDRTSASRAISILDNAIAKVSTQRAKIGAFQDSLEHTVTNLTTTSTNLSAAESRIRALMGVPELRERVRCMAQQANSKLRSLSRNEIVGELLELEPDRWVLSFARTAPGS